MDHFKSARLRNFGPWKDQLFEFHPGVNVLIGESGHGKSAVLKALDFVLNNKTPKSAAGPLGFITRPEERGKIAEVDIEMLSGENIDKISRRKGKSTNEYQLNDNTPQKAMGTNVPDGIAKIINMTSVNYHKQKHLPFLLDEKPGAVAKQLTSIINLQEIDESVALATSCVRENKKILKQQIEIQQDLSEQITDLEYVQEFKAKTDAFIELQNNYYKENAEFDKIDSIVYDIDKLKFQKAQFEGVVGLADAIQAIQAEQLQFEANSLKFDKIVDILNDLEEFEIKQKRYFMLIDLGKKIDEVNQEEISLEQKTNEYYKVKNISYEISDLKIKSRDTQQLSQLSVKIDELCELEASYSAETKRYNSILDCCESIESFQEKSEQLQNKIKLKEIELSKMACPLCGRGN